MQLEFWNDETKPAAASEGKAEKRRNSRVIRASEIGEYLYCQRAWWLGRVKGVENANRAAMEAGIARHRAHGETLQRAAWLQTAALVCAAVALLVGVLIIVVWLGAR